LTEQFKVLLLPKRQPHPALQVTPLSCSSGQFDVPLQADQAAAASSVLGGTRM